MKRNLRLLILSLLLGVTVLSVSCKKDLESITLKRSGNAKITVMNGEAIVANTDVKLYNANSENEIEMLTTDANGVIMLSDMIEGNYGVSIEITSPKYAKIYQEFQILSGESREIVVQVNEYSGALTVYLVDEDKEELIKEDFGIGIAVIPMSDDYQKAFTNADKMALATEVKYFGAAGEITFDNLPVGSYDLYKVKADTIVSQEDDYLYIEKHDTKYFKLGVDYTYEKLFSKVFTISKVYDYDNEVEVSTFPVSTVQFYMEDGDYKIKFTLNNGVEFTGYFEYYSDGEFDLYSLQSSDEDYSLYTSENNFRLNDNGSVEFDFNSFKIYNYSEGGEDQIFYDVTLTLE